MDRINVDIPGNEYETLISSGLKNHIVEFIRKQTKNRDVLVVTDDYLAQSHGIILKQLLEKSGFLVHLFVMKGGKSSKSFNEVLKIYGVLEANNFARDSVLIAMGGGVIGDLAGFSASTWYRGMNLIHVPTTLMAMVDSSIGGKVAINFRDTTNAVGNYYHPIANFIDLDFVDSLPMRDYVSGLAEVIKCALISDESLVGYLEDSCDRVLSKEAHDLVFCIRRAIEIKVDHIRGDVKEAGKRLLLNYGHTLGHAIEMATHCDAGETLRHGEGVALGMVAALYISQTHLGVSPELASRARDLISSFRLPVEFSASEYGYNRSELISSCLKLILKDKKRKNNKLRFILIDSLGHARVHSDVPENTIRSAFESVIRD